VLQRHSLFPAPCEPRTLYTPSLLQTILPELPSIAPIRTCPFYTFKMGLFDKLQASKSIPPLPVPLVHAAPEPPRATLLIRKNRTRALPPRAALHSSREAHHLLQRCPVRRRRVRLRYLAHVVENLLHQQHSEQQPPFQQGTRCEDQRTGALGHRALVSPSHALTTTDRWETSVAHGHANIDTRAQYSCR
jgi:hypothetical protein